VLKHVRIPAIVLSLVLALGATAQAGQVTGKFSYQGLLQSNGLAVNGTADLRFRLYDALTAGNQVGLQTTKLSVAVSEGVFNVELDFGVGAFNGDERWLEIDVRSPSGPGAYETLSPRQALLATPYSIQTRGIYVGPANNVGIGTSTPATKLHVVNDGSTPTVRVENLGTGSAGLQLAASDKEYELRLTDDNRLVVLDKTSGNAERLAVGSGGAVSIGGNADIGGKLGVGTSTPSRSLHVSGAAADLALLESSNTTATRVSIGNTAVGGKRYDLISTAASSGIGGGMFALRDSDGGATFFTVDSLGHMGVGSNVTPSSTSMLVVGGTAEVNVLQINGGSDIAEPFDVADGEGIVPGMVVCIDPDQPGRLRLADAAYDRTVAGVISGAGGVNPGMMLRQGGTLADGTHPVALTGRVYCYVDADANGPVQPGDLLTTSDTPGHAMRVGAHAPAAGAILGKAMTTLESGRGLVLVLVSLQ